MINPPWMPYRPPSFCEESLLHDVERINITLDKLGDLGDSQLGTTLFVPLPFSAFLHLPRCESLQQGYTRVSGAYYHRWTHLTVVLAQGCSTQQPRWPQPEEYCCADFLDSSQGMWPLVEKIVRHSSGISPHVPAALVMAANCPDWVKLDNVDIPIICQHTLLMRPSTATSFSMPPTPTPGPEVWVSLQALPTLEIG